MLVVISNFTHLTNSYIPNMLTQLETALGTSIAEDKQVKTARIAYHLVNKTKYR